MFVVVWFYYGVGKSQRKNAAMLDSDDEGSVSSSSSARTDKMSVSGTEEVRVDQDTLLEQALDALDEKRYLIYFNHNDYFYKRKMVLA